MRCQLSFGLFGRETRTDADHLYAYRTQLTVTMMLTTGRIYIFIMVLSCSVVAATEKCMFMRQQRFPGHSLQEQSHRLINSSRWWCHQRINKLFILWIDQQNAGIDGWEMCHSAKPSTKIHFDPPSGETKNQLWIPEFQGTGSTQCHSPCDSHQWFIRLLNICLNFREISISSKMPAVKRGEKAVTWTPNYCRRESGMNKF